MNEQIIFEFIILIAEIFISAFVVRYDVKLFNTYNNMVNDNIVDLLFIDINKPVKPQSPPPDKNKLLIDKINNILSVLDKEESNGGMNYVICKNIA